MCYPVSVQSWGSKISCISLMGKAPSSQTGDIPYYHPPVTETWGSLLTVSMLDLFCWLENLPWESRFHGEEPSEIQMWGLQTQILLRSDSLRAQVQSGWEPQHSMAAAWQPKRDPSPQFLPANFPYTRPCCWDGLSCSLGAQGLKWPLILMAFQLIPVDTSKACDYCCVSTPHVRLFIYIRALVHSC